MNVPNYTEGESDKGADKVLEAKNDFEKEKLKGEEGTCLTIIEFTSKRKRASVVVKHTVNGTEMARVYTKGAPDMLFPKLSGVLDSDMKLHNIMETSSYDGQECTEIEKLNLVVKKFAD